METPYELTLDLINKTGVDVHLASVSKNSAAIEMTRMESVENVEKVKQAFLSRWGHAYVFTNHADNNAVGCTMIYFKAI